MAKGFYHQRGIKIAELPHEVDGKHIQRKVTLDSGLEVFYCRNCRRFFAIWEMQQDLKSGFLVYDDISEKRVQLSPYCKVCFVKLKKQGKLGDIMSPDRRPMNQMRI